MVLSNFCAKIQDFGMSFTNLSGLRQSNFNGDPNDGH